MTLMMKNISPLPVTFDWVWLGKSLECQEDLIYPVIAQLNLYSVLFLLFNNSLKNQFKRFQSDYTFQFSQRVLSTSMIT